MKHAVDVMLPVIAVPTVSIRTGKLTIAFVGKRVLEQNQWRRQMVCRRQVRVSHQPARTLHLI